MDEAAIYTRIGEEGFAALVRAFYAQIPGDDILGPLYPPDDFAGAEARLRDFLVGRFGGPTRYIDERGHPRLRQRHARFPVDQAARDRWVALMNRALDQTDLPEDIRSYLRSFLDATATFLINRGETA